MDVIFVFEETLELNQTQFTKVYMGLIIRLSYPYLETSNRVRITNCIMQQHLKKKVQIQNVVAIQTKNDKNSASYENEMKVLSVSNFMLQQTACSYSSDTKKTQANQVITFSGEMFHLERF